MLFFCKSCRLWDNVDKRRTQRCVSTERWLRQSATMLRFAYILYLVITPSQCFHLAVGAQSCNTISFVFVCTMSVGIRHVLRPAISSKTLRGCPESHSKGSAKFVPTIRDALHASNFKVSPYTRPPPPISKCRHNGLTPPEQKIQPHAQLLSALHCNSLFHNDEREIPGNLHGSNLLPPLVNVVLLFTTPASFSLSPLLFSALPSHSQGDKW